MTPRKSPALGEALNAPGKVVRPRNITPVTGGLPDGVERVTSPFIRIQPSKLPGWWSVMLVPADRRDTKRLSSWPSRPEAAEAARAEAAYRDLPVPVSVAATVSLGGAHV